MRALKSILRWFLGLQAVVLILTAGVIGVASHPRGSHSHLHAASAIFIYGFAAAIFALGAVYAMAWWTTRKPSATLSIWALAASVLTLAQGVFLFWLPHLIRATRIRFSASEGLWFFAFSLAGLFVFSRREAAPAPAASARKGTPIAGDRTSLATRHAVTGLSVLAQIAALVFWTHWALTQHLSGFHGLSWIVLITIASIATTLIHECGHAVLAWCFEMGFLSFRAGPLHAVKREGNWQFKFHAAGLITPGGAVGAVPTHPAQPRWEEIVMIAAGPAANLLIGTAAIWAVLYDRWASYQQTWELVAYTGAFCLIAAALNFIPFLSEDGGYSDGARILQIVTRSPLDDFHRAIASVASTAVTPRRYRDLDIAQIERAAILFPHDFRGLHLLLCACQFYEECGQLPEASAALAAAQTICDENAIDLPGPLHTIFVIGHAWLNRDATAARLWWDRMEAKQCDHHGVDYMLAKAALFWIEGLPQQAEEAWQEASSEADTLPQFGAFEFDRQLCTLLHEAFQQPSQAAVPAPAPLVAASPVPAPAPALIAAAIPVLPPTPILDAIPKPPSIPLIATAPAVSANPIPAAIPAPAPVPVIATALAPAPTPILAAAPPTPRVPVVATAPAVAPPPIPAAIAALASAQFATAGSDRAPTPAIAPAPAAVPVAPPRSPIAPIAVAEPAPTAPRPVEAIIPIAVAVSEPASDQMDVLSARLNVLTRPVSQPAPIAAVSTAPVTTLADSATQIHIAAPTPIPAPLPALAPTPIIEAVPTPSPVPDVAISHTAAPAPIPPAIPALASTPIIEAVPDPSPVPVITPGPAPEAVASAPSPIAPIAIAETAPAPPRPFEATLPAAVVASGPAANQVDVLSTRLGVLTRPLVKTGPIDPVVETIIDPVAGSTTRIPVAALKLAPARMKLVPDSPAPAALAPPKPNAPAVPAAFARRARPAPLPPGSTPDPFLAFEASAVETPALEAPAVETPAPETPAFGTPQASETPVAAASFASPPDDAPVIIPEPPAVTPVLATTRPAIARVPIAAFQVKPEVADATLSAEKPARYDPFDFIRAAAIENLNASAN